MHTPEYILDSLIQHHRLSRADAEIWRLLLTPHELEDLTHVLYSQLPALLTREFVQWAQPNDLWHLTDLWRQGGVPAYSGDRLAELHHWFYASFPTFPPTECKW